MERAWAGLPIGPLANLLERTATSAAPKRAIAAKAPVGNSGTADVLVLLLVLVELLLVLEVVELDERDELDEVDEELEVEELLEELDVVLAAAVYAKVVTWEATAPFPPHVAFTVNVPVVQAPLPPG